MAETIEIAGFKCVYSVVATADTVTYMLYPDMAAFEASWIDQQASSHNTTVVVIYIPGDQWDNLLTPWIAPGEPKGCKPFGGDASQFYNTLTNNIIPNIEKAIKITGKITRNLIGVSLSGLFTLWQWLQHDFFDSIACLSGSFWYPNFILWFDKQDILTKSGKAFFLLGKAEPHAAVKAYRTVGVNTQSIVDTLHKKGINTTFDWVPGNHFADPTGRAALAFKNLYA